MKRSVGETWWAVVLLGGEGRQSLGRKVRGVERLMIGKEGYRARIKRE